jgi:amidase/aspartyl-tRNA(Asn)/glutamyl-tRNA(Gln) amidotransferase subunit A
MKSAPVILAAVVTNRDDGNTLGPLEVNGQTVDPLIGWCLTYPINFTGHPAASIPAGMIKNLPVGMQIIGRRFKGRVLLSLTWKQPQDWMRSLDCQSGIQPMHLCGSRL